MEHIKYMKLAFKESKKAFDKNEVPVGAVIVENEKVIAKAYNQKDSTGIVTKHAEIIAIEKACRKKKDWRLNDCIIYTTLEPCPMCVGAIRQARMKLIVYGASSQIEGNCELVKKIINDHTTKTPINIIGGVLERDCSQIIKEFFNRRRQISNLDVVD